MANQDELREKLKLGIEAARRGDRQAAELLLRQVVNADPDNELGWMWLASAVSSVDERRTCLQNALRINPQNTRAQEALRRLSGESAPNRERGRRVVDQLRRQPTIDEPRSSGRSVVTLIIGGVIVVALIGALVFGLVFVQQANIFNPPTPVDPAAAAAAAFNPTATPSPDPETFTDTPTPPRIIVTRDPALVDLPPTFTPTFTPTPLPTLTPTATPYPLSIFRMIYTSINPGDAQPDLYEALGDGSDERRLAGNVRDVVYDRGGQRIAFVRDVSIGEEGEERIVTELFVAPASDPGNAQQLTQLGQVVSNPTWSPDGIQLAFTMNSGIEEQIWIITEDGQNARPLTADPGVNREPAWSPDGDVILYVSDHQTPGETKIYSITPDGSDPVRVGSLGGNSYSPRWSIDGRLITFVNDGGGSDSDIYVMERDGSNQTLLTVDDGGAEDRAPVFTPDTRWVAFVSNREGDTFQIYVVDLRGIMVERLTRTDHDHQAVDFYPDLTLRLPISN